MAYILDFDVVNPPRLGFEWEDRPENKVSFGLSSSIDVDPKRLPSLAILTDWNRRTSKNGPDTFPDIIAMWGSNAVSQRFKDLVESFEPDVHLFHPITLKRPDDTPISPNYYIFSANQHADFILTKESGVEWRFYDDWPDQELRKAVPSIEWSPFVLGLESNKKNLRISRPVIQYWHLYTHKRAFHYDKLFVSDEFYAALKKEKIKHFYALGYCEELDMAWDEEENFGPALGWLRMHDTHPGNRNAWEASPEKERGDK